MHTTPEERFTAAYHEYHGALLRYGTSKISNREGAKDLVQETFFRTWRYMHEGNAIANLKAFLYKTLGNLIIDSYRKRPCDDSLECLHEQGFDPGSDDTSQWMDSIDGIQAIGLLEEVREPYRDMLSMRYVQGYSISEIAEASDTSKNTVTVRLHRGLHILQTLFTNRAKAGAL